MINLLPPSAKKEFIAGRVNTLLVRYLWIIGILFVLLAFICGLTYMMLETIKTNKQQQIQDNTSKVKDYATIRQQAAAFQSNLSVAKSIMDRQTYYSGALLKISKYLVPGTILQSISLDRTTYGTPMTLQILAADTGTAVRLKDSLQSSSLFSDVHFQTVDLSTGGTPSNGVTYHTSVTMQVTINKDGIGNEAF